MTHLHTHLATERPFGCSSSSCTCLLTLSAALGHRRWNSTDGAFTHRETLTIEIFPFRRNMKNEKPRQVVWFLRRNRERFCTLSLRNTWTWALRAEDDERNRSATLRADMFVCVYLCVQFDFWLQSNYGFYIFAACGPNRVFLPDRRQGWQHWG